MDFFKDDIKNEQRRIQRLIDLTTPSQPLPEEESGWLSIKHVGNQTYCYQVRNNSEGKTEKKYLGTCQSAPVRAWVDHRFRDEKLRRLERDAALLEKLETQYQAYDVSAIQAALPKTYRGLLSEDQFSERYRQLQAWASAEYERNSAPFPKAQIFAKDGTRMRSKGECMFYNIFDERSLPNRYDCVLRFIDRNGREMLMSPDFLIQCFDGSYIIIEHLGWYSGLKYGVNFGENFFVTSDDANGGTDSRMIMDVVRQVERKFYGY